MLHLPGPWSQTLSKILTTALAACSIFPSAQSQELTTADRFEIFSEMNKHQVYIDNNGSYDNAKLYANLYWPDGSFRVVDPDGRDSTVCRRPPIIIL
jgi:hypothetical protein